MKHFIKNSNNSFSLVEVSLAALVLAIGVCSILSVFPVAMQWGTDSMANNTGAIAAKTALAYLYEDATDDGATDYDLTDGTATKTYDVGTVGEGGYYCTADVSTQTPSTLKYVTLKIYRSKKAGAKLYTTFTTYVYDD
jgi:Tfp pilus assembly protein PilV